MEAAKEIRIPGVIAMEGIVVVWVPLVAAAEPITAELSLVVEDLHVPTPALYEATSLVHQLHRAI